MMTTELSLIQHNSVELDRQALAMAEYFTRRS